ncbi:MAG: metallophosphoesterase [Ruminococcus sp.]
MSEKKQLTLRRKKRRVIAGGISLLLTLDLYMWGFSLKTENYVLKSDKLENGLKIVFISDLHNCIYGGPEQTQLIREIEKAEPDLVLFGGDVVDQYGGTDNALTVMKYAAEKYPCCYAEGNHEQSRDDLGSFVSQVRSLGINVLEGDCAEYEIDGQRVNVLGMTDINAKRPKSTKYKTQLDSCIEKVNPDSYNILLLHQPDGIGSVTGHGFDLILSGHAHAGQWRLPFVLEQGTYAPDQGIFPDRTNGLFNENGTVQIISRGLAIPMRMCVIPRIFNRPELTVIEINAT